LRTAENLNASPVDVYDYVLWRAAKALIVAKVVEYCRNVAVLLLLRDSERENNFCAYQLANDRWFEHVQKVIRMGCGHA